MTIADEKFALRKKLCQARLAHAAALPREVRALIFARPPSPVLAMVSREATIGLYCAGAGEAPASSYARFFFERGHKIALPRVTALAQPMQFHEHSDPFEESDLVSGPLGLRQPAADAPILIPDVLFMPLVGFTANGDRIGQGGGFYDRWLAAHRATIAIGMAWDVQRVDELPLEPHDQRLTAIVTPTRIYGPF